MNAVGTETRARQSRGTSSDSILEMVGRALESRKISGDCLVDVGCGAGNLYRYLGSGFPGYVGVDVVKYDDFPEEARFCQFDLDSGSIPLPDHCADVVAAVEVIEHLENPRQFVRSLVRLARPGGWVVVTTPNQLSALSLLTLVGQAALSGISGRAISRPPDRTAGSGSAADRRRVRIVYCLD